MTAGLQRLASRTPTDQQPRPEQCEFCQAVIDERHGHVADVLGHRLLCTCRPCYLLFAPTGAGGGRYKGVGEEVRTVPDLALTTSQWDSLRIPVELAFFFRQESRWIAFYPSPGGATESELDLTVWTELVDANPAVDECEPDVEAVLLRRTDGAFTCHVVPIDRCYELVGIVRSAWRGLDGGTEVWRAIDEFFADLEATG